MLDIFKQAKKGEYAVGAFNVSNLEQVKAIVGAAEKMRSPVIISTSEGEGEFVDFAVVRAVIDVYKKRGLEIILHLDHGKSFEAVEKAILAGYDSVQIDGSKLIFEENIELTKRVVKLAGKKKVKNIEGELGCLAGSSKVQQMVEIKKEDLTVPDEALSFIKKTGVDSLAVAIGNVHGVLSGGPDPHLFLDRLALINEKIGDKAALVLHGGSGIPEEDIKQAINLGIAKINVNTELRLAYVNGLKKVLAENPDETTPYKLLPPVIDAVQKVVEDKITLFKSENRL